MGGNDRLIVCYYEIREIMSNKYPSSAKIVGYLNKELPVQAADDVEAWFVQAEGDKKELERLEAIWGLAGRLEQMQKIDKQKAKAKIESRLAQSGATRKLFLHYFQKIAAMLIVPVLLFSAYLFFQNGKEGSAGQEFVASYGARSALTLPDGSKVWLNSGSKLSYGQDFNHNDRQIYLTGEAFFDVAANKSKPFDVVTGRFTVRAVGTSFNVFSYSGNEFESSLEEGATQVFLSGDKNQGAPILSMSPGERVVFNEKNGELILSEADVKQYSTWKDGKLTFKNTPMREVANKLERWFNIDIELKDQELLKYRYTAVIKNETILQTLEMLSFSAPIGYDIAPGEKQHDGTCSRSKVEFRIRH